MPQSERAFLERGVRFLRVATRTDGITIDRIKVQGPRDEALMAALRDAVAARSVADLPAARAAVLAAYKGPMAVRSGEHPKGKRWRAEGLPESVCETCGGERGRFVEQDGRTVVKSGCGGMCSLCMIARAQVLEAKWAA